MKQSDLLELLADVLAFLDNQADAEYNCYGVLIGNDAMRLYCELDQAKADIERSGVKTD